MACLGGIIDIHIHTFPDIRLRRVTDFSLAEEAREVGAKAVVLKSHYFPTMERAWLTHRLYPEVEVFGGITLNPPVGGLNRTAVEAAIRLGAKIVWLPTLFSSNQRAQEGRTDGLVSVVGGKVVPALRVILKIIAESDIVLATGHLSASEIEVVVEEAVKQGVRKIVVSHPEHKVISMSIADQKRLLSANPVLFERCYAQPVGDGTYKLNLSDNLLAVQEIGYASTVLSTDCGQLENPTWKDTINQYVDFFYAHGVAKEEIDWMTRTLPGQLLGIKPASDAV
jgi:hypothetical protein